MKRISFIQLKFQSFEIFLICTPNTLTLTQADTCQFKLFNVNQSEKLDEELFKQKYGAL